MKHPIDLVYLMSIYSNDQKTVYNSLICSKRISGYIKRWKIVEVVNLFTKSINTHIAKSWFKNGKRHREGDLPARIWKDGTKEWWENGEFHREGDKPAIISAYGYKAWYKNGKCYREDCNYLV